MLIGFGNKTNILGEKGGGGGGGVTYTFMECLCHKSPRTCSVCRNHHPLFFSCMTCILIFNNNITTGANSEEGTADPSGAPEFIL